MQKRQHRPGWPLAIAWRERDKFFYIMELCHVFPGFSDRPGRSV
jgi:hypothetical protein